MELMVVIAIVGILSSIAIPNILSYRDNSRLRAAASEMLATFRKAQVNAVKRNFNTGLIFNATTGTTTVYLDNGGGVSGNANNSTQNTGEPTIDTYTIPVGCNLSAVSFSGGATTTGFTPRGLPIRTGSVNVQSTSANSNVTYQIALSMAGHTRINVISN
jgi:Tfp pilus assembly protein FimT